MRGPEGAPSTIRAGETTYIGNTKVSAEQLEPLVKPATGTTARAEGAHAFIAIQLGIGVKKATIQSGPGYLGMVEVDRADARVAAAHLGQGDSHDRRVIRWLGADEHSSHTAAKGILASDPEGYDAVTTLLEKKRTVNGHQIKEAIHEAKERKEYVLVVFRTPEGRVFKKKTKTINGEAIIQEIKTPQEQIVFEPEMEMDKLALAA